MIANSMTGFGSWKPKVTIGHDEFYYSGSATEKDARALGEALESKGYLADQGASVALEKGKNGTIITFAIRDGAWNDVDMSAIETACREVAPSVGGLPITLRLMTIRWEIKKERLIK